MYDIADYPVVCNMHKIIMMYMYKKQYIYIIYFMLIFYDKLSIMRIIYMGQILCQPHLIPDIPCS